MATKKFLSYDGLAEYDTLIKAYTENAVSNKQDKLAGAEGQVIGFDADGNPVGVNVSWNDLADKPFGESFGDTLMWDGDTVGREVTFSKFFKVSDVAPIMDDLSNGFSVVFGSETLEVSAEESANFVITGRGSFGLMSTSTSAYGEPFAWIFPQDYLNITKGTYFIDCRDSAPGQFTSSLTINGYNGFPIVDKIDEKFIPDTIQRTINGTVGQMVGFDENGSAVAQHLPEKIAYATDGIIPPDPVFTMSRNSSGKIVLNVYAPFSARLDSYTTFGYFVLYNTTKTSDASYVLEVGKNGVTRASLATAKFLENNGNCSYQLSPTSGTKQYWVRAGMVYVKSDGTSEYVYSEQHLICRDDLELV